MADAQVHAAVSLSFFLCVCLCSTLIVFMQSVVRIFNLQRYGVFLG